MPSSSRTSAFARRAKRCAAEPSRANSVSSLRDAGVKKPRRIMPTVESQSRRLARGIFGFSQSRGIHLPKSMLLVPLRRAYSASGRRSGLAVPPLPSARLNSWSDRSIAGMAGDDGGNEPLRHAEPEWPSPYREERSMAKIWPCYDNDATVHPWGERSINWCEKRLGLCPSDYRCDREQFGPRGKLQTEPDHTHVVV